MSVSSPVFGIVGWKNSGKTTLLERLVAHMSAQGLAVSTVKHAHHDVEVDRAGTDSWRHRRAGAVEVLLATPHRCVLIHELRDAPAPSLDALLARLQPADLILVEGFKEHRHPKLETSRSATAQSLLAHADATVRAVAADYPPPDLDRPVFDLDDVGGIARFVQAEVLR